VVLSLPSDVVTVVSEGSIGVPNSVDTVGDIGGVGGV